MSKALSLTFLLAFVLSPLSASWASDFEGGVKAYYQNQTRMAEDAFTKVLTESPKSGAVWYNLGNVHYRQGEIGKARQAYEKALRVLPRSERVKKNLALLVSRLKDAPQESLKSYLLKTFYFWVPWLKLLELQLVTLVFTTLCSLIVLLKVLKTKKILSFRLGLSVVIFSYLVVGYSLRSEQLAEGRFGVILAPEVEVKANYLDQGGALFLLHEGTKVEVIDKQVFSDDNSWHRVQLPEGQNGWMRSQDLGMI